MQVVGPATAGAYRWSLSVHRGAATQLKKPGATDSRGIRQCGFSGIGAVKLLGYPARRVADLRQRRLCARSRGFYLCVWRPLVFRRAVNNMGSPPKLRHNGSFHRKALRGSRQGSRPVNLQLGRRFRRKKADYVAYSSRTRLLRRNPKCGSVARY